MLVKNGLTEAARYSLLGAATFGCGYLLGYAWPPRLCREADFSHNEAGIFCGSVTSIFSISRTFANENLNKRGSRSSQFKADMFSWIISIGLTMKISELAGKQFNTEPLSLAPGFFSLVGVTYFWNFVLSPPSNNQS